MQVIFTVLLITLFNHRNFAAGTAFSKTEVLQAAIFEALIIGEIVNFQVGMAIGIGVLAILMLSFHKSDAGLSGLFSSLRSKQSLLGWQLAHFWGCHSQLPAATDSLATVILCSELYVGGDINLITNTFHGRDHVPDGKA